MNISGMRVTIKEEDKRKLGEIKRGKDNNPILLYTGSEEKSKPKKRTSA